MKTIYLEAGIIIALIVGAGIGWVVYPMVYPASSVVTTAKFGNGIPPNGTTIIHGFDASYPPFTQINGTGQAVGFDVDVMTWIANKYGWNLVEKPWQWSTIVTALQAGDVDVVASGMMVTAARAEVITFTIPYISLYQCMVVNINETRNETQILNSGGYISTESSGAAGDVWLQTFLSQGYNFKELGLASNDLAIQALLDGRAIAFMTSSTFLKTYFTAHPDAVSQVRELTQIGGTESNSYATRNGDTGLRDALNLGLEQLMNSAEWDVLTAKWGV